MLSSLDRASSDLEKVQSQTRSEAGVLQNKLPVEEDPIATRHASSGISWRATLQRLAGRYGVEQRGIEKVSDHERTDTTMTKVGTIWLSANMVVSSFALGALAIPVFDLGYLDAALAIIFFNLLGALSVSFFSSFGPKFGLRQMVLSRFYFGYHVNKMVAAFNVLACIGWSAVNLVVGSQLFHAINQNVPGWGGIIVLAASTLIIALFGYRIVHIYERWSWIPSFMIFLVVLGVFASSHGFDPDTPDKTVREKAGSVLSFGASVFGYATGWTSFAADYTVYQPPSTSRRSVFLWTMAGLLSPLLFTELLGAAVATATKSDANFEEAYQAAGIGGLLAQVLVPSLSKFGEFCIVVLGLSTIANNCPNMYSASLTLQVLSTATQKVPRFMWAIAGSAISVAIAIPAYSKFERALEAFMVSIAYWLAIYEGISLTEHFAFRRSLRAYALENYTKSRKLPAGWASLGAFCTGAVGVMLGMANELFVGPIGRLCGGKNGGDIGFELGFVFASLSYLVFRTLEKGYFRR